MRRRTSRSCKNKRGEARENKKRVRERENEGKQTDRQTNKQTKKQTDSVDVCSDTRESSMMRKLRCERVKNLEFLGPCMSDYHHHQHKVKKLTSSGVRYTLRDALEKRSLLSSGF